MKKDITSLWDLTAEDFENLFQRAVELKSLHGKGDADRHLAGRTLGLLFEKASTRTRLSFEAGMAQLGGTAIFINTKDTQMARSEPIRDTARVLSGYLDALAIRTFSQQTLEDFARHAEIPVINALTDRYHPCQVLSDIMTIVEKKGGYKGIKIAWFGDGNNVCHSWINAAGVLGLHLVMACPEGYFPDESLIEHAGKNPEAALEVTSDPRSAVDGADVIYTDVWASMGQEGEATTRKRAFGPFQVNEGLLEAADHEAIVMHCLPAHRGEEITEEVLEGPNAVVWDQSENKLHMHKAVLDALITGR